jgi:O-antigen ligase
MHTLYKGASSNILMPDHIGLFTSAIDIFKKNLFIGSGVKTFRINCKYVAEEKKIELKKNIPNIKFCSTHPHNYYLQLLAETGLIGFLMILSFFLLIISSYFKILIFWFKNKKESLKKTYACIISALVTTFWPLTTTGSFFNNWNCSIIFFTLGIYLFVKSNDS